MVTENDRATKYASVGFDASVWEIFPYLIEGASIYIFEDHERYDTNSIHNFFQKNKITISFLPTPMCEQFLKLEKECRALRILKTGGDKINFFKKRSFTVFNIYGPTENTVVSSYFPIDRDYNNIPIGKHPAVPITTLSLRLHGKWAGIWPVNWKKKNTRLPW